MDQKITNSMFHESRDSMMDKRLPKKTFFQKYKFYLLGGVVFFGVLLVVLGSGWGGS